MSSRTRITVQHDLLTAFLSIIQPLARLESLTCDHVSQTADVCLTMRSGADVSERSIAIFTVDDNKLTLSIEPVSPPQTLKEPT